jgi:hypothetical protein
MGFSIYYRSTRPIEPAEVASIEHHAAQLCAGRSWLHCEPVGFVAGDDGHLLGGSKPNFLPDQGDAEAARKSGLPDGTIHDMLDVLAKLSIDHGIDWEISHDGSNGPIGRVHDGVCDPDVVSQIEAFEDLADILTEDFDEHEDEDLIDS